MKCLFIGICHIGAISTILKDIPSFTAIYNDILSYTIFSTSEEEMGNILENIVPTCDLVLSQPVSDNYRNNNIFSTTSLRSKIKPGAVHLVIANCYFTGYDPIPFQITDNNGTITHLNNVSYFPSISLISIINKNLDQACIDWCNPSAHTTEEISFNYLSSINALKSREEKIFDSGIPIDISISDYIEKNYQSKFLFHTYNHPTNELLFELVKRILHKLGIPLSITKCHISKELLGDITIPPPPSVYINSNMSFQYPLFSINGISYTTREAMKIFIAIMAKSDVNLHNQWISSIKYGRTKLHP